MSGHDFEKQVRQTLNDLKLTPSSKVWENIEENLHERKRRPAMIYWLPLLLIGLSAGGYFLFRAAPENELAQLHSHQQPNSANEPFTSESKTQSLSQTFTPSIKSAKERASSSENSLVPEKNFSSHNTTALKKPLPAKRNPIAQPKSTDQTIESAEKTSKGARAPSSENKLALSIAPQAIANEKSLNYKKPVFATNFKTSWKNDFPSPEAKSLNNTSSPATAPKKKALAKKWSFGVSAFAGISSVNEGKLLGFNNAQVEDVSTVAPFAPQQPAYTPSSISSGLAYSLGAFAQREVSTKVSLSVGLNYLQLNTRNKVGYQVTNRMVVNNGPLGFLAVSNYFTIDRDNTREYRNRYHFIEVPVEAHVKLGNVKKLPVQLNTGVAVSHLLRSNSLHFDGTTGIYYRNDKLLNQTQVAAKAGFSVSILNNSKRPISLGPSVRYNISKILEKDVSARKSFMSIGLDARMRLK